MTKRLFALQFFMMFRQNRAFGLVTHVLSVIRQLDPIRMKTGCGSNLAIVLTQ